MNHNTSDQPDNIITPLDEPPVGAGMYHSKPIIAVRFLGTRDEAYDIAAWISMDPSWHGEPTSGLTDTDWIVNFWRGRPTPGFGTTIYSLVHGEWITYDGVGFSEIDHDVFTDDFTEA